MDVVRTGNKMREFLSVHLFTVLKLISAWIFNVGATDPTNSLFYSLSLIIVDRFTRRVCKKKISLIIVLHSFGIFNKPLPLLLTRITYLGGAHPTPHTRDPSS